jgi:hypothetical protein
VSGYDAGMSVSRSWGGKVNPTVHKVCGGGRSGGSASPGSGEKRFR